jgi:hypothetical protein
MLKHYYRYADLHAEDIVTVSTQLLTEAEVEVYAREWKERAVCKIDSIGSEGNVSHEILDISRKVVSLLTPTSEPSRIVRNAEGGISLWWLRADVRLLLQIGLPSGEAALIFLRYKFSEPREPDCLEVLSPEEAADFVEHWRLFNKGF